VLLTRFSSGCGEYTYTLKGSRLTNTAFRFGRKKILWNSLDLEPAAEKKTDNVLRSLLEQSRPFSVYHHLTLGRVELNTQPLAPFAIWNDSRYPNSPELTPSALTTHALCYHVANSHPVSFDGDCFR
jgi:hypothetical protein